jgi:hypothetical protein
MRTKKTINKLVQHEKAGFISETCSFKRDLVFRRETWHSPRDTWRLADKPEYNRESLQARIFLTIFQQLLPF